MQFSINDNMDTDVLIIGSGPAGIQAAIHASRKKVSVVLLGRISDSAMDGTHIENYFGIDGISDGTTMLRIGLEQAKKFGCTILQENVTSAEHTEDTFKIMTENDVEINARSIIIATGISRAKLNVPGEKEFFGKGVSYCASCDCNFYKGKVVVIIGDDTEAAGSADMMTGYASKVYWVFNSLKASQKMIDKARASGVELISGKVASINGDDKVRSIILSDGNEITTDGVFIELGAKSAADLAMDMDLMPEMDDTIKVKSDCSTDVKGIFACGDVTGRPWQVAKAVGQGAIAGSAAAGYVKGE